MYCAPLGAAYARRSDELARLAPKLSALTHYDRRCGTAVLAVTLAAAAAVRGTGRQAAVSEALGAVADLEGGEETEFLVEAVGEVRAIDGPDQGFCLYAAGAGLQALARDGTFEEELRRIVGLGGDTDTNAAVAGALVGAAAGRPGLPEDWLARLSDRAVIEEEANRLASVTERLTGTGDR
jgi:ADP-ribosyl-[dinitrogen reductase] hydrolase